MLLKPAIQSAGFHPGGGGGGGGGRERRKEEKERKRERQRKKERCMVWEGGACTFLRCIASDQYSPTS